MQRVLVFVAHALKAALAFMLTRRARGYVWARKLRLRGWW